MELVGIESLNPINPKPSAKAHGQPNAVAAHNAVELRAGRASSLNNLPIRLMIEILNITSGTLNLWELWYIAYYG